MTGQHIIDEHQDWIEDTARRLALDFQEPIEDCSQSLALYLLRGECRKFARLHVIRDLLKERKWHSWHQTCSAVELDHLKAQHRFHDRAELADFIDVCLTPDEQLALSFACHSLDTRTIALCMECSHETVSKLLQSIKAKLEDEIND